MYNQYNIDNVELHIRVIAEISPSDNFYTVQLFPFICPRGGIEISIHNDSISLVTTDSTSVVSSIMILALMELQPSQWP